MLKKFLLPALCLVCLTACSTEEGKDPSMYENRGGDSMGVYGEGYDVGMGSVYGDGMDMGGMVAEGMTSYMETSGSATIEEVASWELMKKHGQYYATAHGKVYPYGEELPTEEAPALWDQAKDGLDEIGDDLKDMGEDFKDSVEEMR
ncbi:MAG: hypothetical protein R3Y63_07885 [Eubacteriales bacterium]